jgi:hypothetical protein
MQLSLWYFVLPEALDVMQSLSMSTDNKIELQSIKPYLYIDKL